MNHAEAEFRRIESMLDGLIAKAEGELRSADVQITDHSARTYHYKNERLLWSYSFSKEWYVGVECARVTVSLTFTEPFASEKISEIELSWHADLFRKGGGSRINKGNKSKRSVTAIEQQGISSVVADAMDEGSAYLPKSLQQTPLDDV